MTDVTSSTERRVELAPRQYFDVQAHLRSERDQIALLNAALSEGQPEVLVGAIWDVMRANDVAGHQGVDQTSRLDVRRTAGDGGTAEADNTLTPDQVIAGRTLLGWSASRLAKRCDLSVRTVVAVESDKPRSARSLQALDRIRPALEAAGVTFGAGHVDGSGVTVRTCSSS